MTNCLHKVKIALRRNKIRNGIEKKILLKISYRGKMGRKKTMEGSFFGFEQYMTKHEAINCFLSDSTSPLGCELNLDHPSFCSPLY